jgi:hypothetical protein
LSSGAVLTALPLVQAFCAQDFLIGRREAVKHPKVPPFLEGLPTPRQLNRIGPGFQAGLSVQSSYSIQQGQISKGIVDTKTFPDALSSGALIDPNFVEF